MIIISSLFFIYFVFAPLKSRFRFSVLKTVLLLSILSIVSTAATMMLFVTGDRHFRFNVISILFLIICAVIIFCTVIRGSRFEGLFITLAVLNIYASIITIAKLGAEMTVWDVSPLTARAFIAAGIFLLYMPLLWVLVFRLFKPAIEMRLDLPAWKFVWYVPALTYVMFYVKIMKDYWDKPVQVTLEDIAFNILWSLSSYIFFCVLLILLIQSGERMMAREQARLTAVQLKMQEERYEQQLDNMEESARARHDWRHHLLTISGLAREEKLDELKEYLSELMPEGQGEEEMPVCEKYVVNIILQHYSAAARAEGIDMKIRADVPGSLDLPDSELCIIYGNLLENAIEACKEQEGTDRYISVKTAVHDKILVIIIKNTYDREVKVKGGIYYSTKHKGSGIGLQSVRSVVEKNKGYMQLEHDGSYFSVKIMMNLHRGKLQ